MHHFVAEEAAAQLADDAQLGARLQLLLLARIEIEKAQVERALAVARLHNQLPPRAILNLVVDDFRFNLPACTGLQFGDAKQLGFVFVAQRQVQHQVELGAHAKLGELGLQ